MINQLPVIVEVAIGSMSTFVESASIGMSAVLLDQRRKSSDRRLPRYLNTSETSSRCVYRRREFRATRSSFGVSSFSGAQVTVSSVDASAKIEKI